MSHCDMLWNELMRVICSKNRFSLLGICCCFQARLANEFYSFFFRRNLSRILLLAGLNDQILSPPLLIQSIPYVLLHYELEQMNHSGIKQ